MAKLASDKHLIAIKDAFISTAAHLFINDIASRAKANPNVDVGIVDSYIAQCNVALSQYTGAGIGKLLEAILDCYNRKVNDGRDVFKILAERTALDHMKNDLTHEHKLAIARNYAKALVKEMHRLAVDHAKTILHPKNRINHEYLMEINDALDTTFELTKSAIRKSITSPHVSDQTDQLKKTLVQTVKQLSKAEADVKIKTARIAELEDALSKSMTLISQLKKSKHHGRDHAPEPARSTFTAPEIDNRDTISSFSATVDETTDRADSDDGYGEVTFDSEPQPTTEDLNLPSEYMDFEKNIKELAMWS